MVGTDAISFQSKSLIVIYWITILYAFGALHTKNEHVVIKPGLYEYRYISMYFWGKPPHSSWVKPRYLEDHERVAYRIINKGLIYKGYFNSASGKYRWGDTLTLVPKLELRFYDPVPSKVLDYELVGAYFFDKRFKDVFTVIYYSKKRNAVMEQFHAYELNRIEAITLYMNKQVNPLTEVSKYFKLRKPKDSIYKLPVKVIKQ